MLLSRNDRHCYMRQARRMYICVRLPAYLFGIVLLKENAFMPCLAQKHVEDVALPGIVQENT